MSAPNPMENTYSGAPPAVSKKVYPIAGIRTTVYGLDELSPEIKNVACLWLLHPRLQTQACMEPIAASTIGSWNQRLRQMQNPGHSIGLIAVSFDQRNHGSREIDALANEAWRSGNKRHAQDMFSIYHGTSLDTSQLITYLPSYIFPTSSHTLTTNLVLGISLGGHAAWHCILHDPRITTAMVIIGCPDYIRLMSDRARLSKLQTYTNSSPPGSHFIGSTDFPPTLVSAVEQFDPAGLLWSEVAASKTNVSDDSEPTETEKRRVIPILKSSLQGKRILNLAGGADKLVPYKCGEPFLKWLKKAIGPGGWFQEGNVVLEDVVFEGVGHEMSPGMVKEVVRFLCETLDNTTNSSVTKSSKI
ncbi:hypothetical protein MMC20_002453 [Loxospora ochrophaea]|nr:hypothetical protein [Loxospora ochrophaea]